MFSHELYNTGNTESDDNSLDFSMSPPFSLRNDKPLDDYGVYLPLAIRVAARTIGLDLVTVQPIGDFTDTYEKIKQERLREERKKKIEDLFPEMKKHEK